MDFEELEGKTLVAIDVSDNNDEMLFTCNDGSHYKLYHEQDGSENVSIEDICGDLEDLLDSPILVAEESSDHKDNTDDKSHTWTYYKLDTAQGGVTIRWYGSSNGYYSERVTFERYSPPAFPPAEL